MQLQMTIEVWQKGDWFIAKCPELDFVAQGRTREEARDNLIEVVEIQFEEMRDLGTLDEYLAECGYERKNDLFIPDNEMVGFEKISLQVA